MRIRQLCYLWLLLLIVACAGMTPEQKIDRGYKASSASVRGASALLNRHAISSADAERVEVLGRTAKAGLDADKEHLAKCHATPGAVCDDITASVDLYSGVLMQLETYLKAKEAK